MNKSELIDAIAASADIPKAAAGRALDAVIESVTGALKGGDSVVLV
ncbi:MAG: HU family DNA-binding protein, partial [Pseudomonas graminis]